MYITNRKKLYQIIRDLYNNKLYSESERSRDNIISLKLYKYNKQRVN